MRATSLREQVDADRHPLLQVGGGGRTGPHLGLLKHGEKLTLFLTVARAPLDNNVCERALKKAIRLLGGKCSIRSKPGQGTGVTVELPVKQAGYDQIVASGGARRKAARPL